MRQLFGVALVAHVVGNWHQPDLPSVVGILELVVGLLGISLLVRPSGPVFQAAASATLLSVVAEMPQTGNHWLLAGLASLVIIATRGQNTNAGLRWLLLVFYGFAAFAKLNTGFFDPNTSCAVFYANQSLNSWGLLTVSPESPIAKGAIWASAIVELSIVPLLVWRKTRWAGIVIGSLFHGVISLDLDQHFYDFTAVLFVLFGAFIPQLEQEASENERTGLIVKWVVAPAALVLVLLSVLPQTGFSSQVLSVVPFLLWVPFLFQWLRFVLRKWAPVPLGWRLTPAAGAVVALAVLNGLTPYTELKTAYGFNMYSNLVTAQGSTNHFIVPQTLPLRDGYEGPVEIIESSDPGLQLYRDLGYLIAYPQFQRYLVDRSVSVTFIRNGVTTSLSDTQAEEGLATPGPWWWRFMPLRALDQQSPPRCQDVFLPAL